MNHDFEQTEDLIDLGAASVETKGAVGAPDDEIGLYLQTGISED